MTFLLAHTLPAGIIAGILFFNGFGIAFQWLIGSTVIRSLIGAGVLLIMILFKRKWVVLFLMASPRRVFFKDDKHQKLYIQNALFKSWLLGFLFLLVFSMPFHDGFWPVFLLSLGFVAAPFFNQRSINKKLHIFRSEKRIFTSWYPVLLILVVLALTRFAATFKINF
jgi:hypothetical protein